MDLEVQKLMKLKNLEQNLTALLLNIDKEINQTSIEWMHLTAIVKENYGTQSQDQNVNDAQKINLIQLQKQIDDDSNTTKLDLALKDLFDDEEEEEN